MANLRGLVAPGATAIYKAEIAAKYRGDGPTILVNADDTYADVFTRARANGQTVDQADEVAKNEILRTTIHEASHILADNSFKTQPIAEPQVARRVFEKMLNLTFADFPVLNRGLSGVIWN